MSKTHTNRLIRRADVLRNLAPIGVTELPESHARELASLSKEDQQVVHRFVKGTAPEGTVTQRHLKSVVTIVKDVMAAGAIDDGSGEMVPWDILTPERKAAFMQANVTEDTYERQQRQQQHIKDGVAGRQHRGFEAVSALLPAVRQVLGDVDVDAASTDATSTIEATVRFKDDEGLERDWPGRVVLNLPRSDAAAFVTHLLDQHQQGITTAAIVVASAVVIGARWFQPLFDCLVAIPCARSRSEPAGSDGGLRSHVVVYIGSEADRFTAIFRELGPVLTRVGP